MGCFRRYVLATYLFISSPVLQPPKTEQYVSSLRGCWPILGVYLDRIEMMLKFAPGYDQSIEQFATFMETAEEGLVVVRDGMWRLNKWILGVVSEVYLDILYELMIVTVGFYIVSALPTNEDSK